MALAQGLGNCSGDAALSGGIEMGVARQRGVAFTKALAERLQLAEQNCFFAPARINFKEVTALLIERFARALDAGHRRQRDMASIVVDGGYESLNHFDVGLGQELRRTTRRRDGQKGPVLASVSKKVDIGI